MLGSVLSLCKFALRSGTILGLMGQLCGLTYITSAFVIVICASPMLKVFHSTSIKDRPNTAASDGAVKGRSYLFMVSEAM